MKQKVVISSFLIAIILRLLYLITPQLNSDHAVIGLIARHILKGEFPLFFYGFYFEAPIEGYIAAPFFWLFGASRIVLDCVPAIMSLILIYAIYKLAYTIFGNPTAKLALILSSIAPSFFLSYTTVPMNGYIETAILGTVAFIVTYKIIYPHTKNFGVGIYNQKRLHFLLGLIIGFAFYLHFHIIPYAATTAIVLFLNDKRIIFRRQFLYSILGFLIGNSPLLIYNITHGWRTFHEIGKGIEHSTFLGTMKHLFGQGFQILLGTEIVLPVFIASFIYLILKRRKGAELLITFLIIFPITYWLSGRGEVNTLRYLLPLYPVIPIMLAYLLNAIRLKNISYSIIGLVLGANLYTNLKSITIFNPRELTNYKAELSRDKELYNFLKTNNIKGVYTLSWWISLKLNFDFKEDIIFNLPLDEPYPAYGKIVDSQSNPGLVTYFSELDTTFNSIGGSYKTHSIPSPVSDMPPYNIYYDFLPVQQTLEEIDHIGLLAYPSHNTESSGLAVDRDIATRWQSGTPQKKDMSFTIDLGRIYTEVTRVCWNPGPATDWPASCELYTSHNGKTWRYAVGNTAIIAPVFWNGPHPWIMSINGLIELDFPPQSARYLKLVLTKDKEYFDWSIAELYIYRRKDTIVSNWNIDRLKERISQLDYKRAYADPWVTSQIDSGFYLIDKYKPVRKGYIHRYFVIKPDRLKDYIFIVLEENYPSFIKQLNGIPCNTEDFGPYRLITFDKEAANSPKLYWDGFHLLKCTL